MCYACVRECPAKAIQIVDGQASVIQTALHRLRQLRHRLQPERQAGARAAPRTPRRCSPADAPVAAIVAPSFPAEFTDMRTPGAGRRMLRDLGFDSRPRGRASAPTWWPREYARLLEESTTGATSPPPARRWSLRAQVPPRPARPPRAHRLADGGHRPRAAPRSTGPTSRSSSSGPASPRRARPATSSSRARSTRRSPSSSCAPCSQRAASSLTGRRRADDDFDPPHGGLGALFPITARHAAGRRAQRGPAERRHRERRRPRRTSSTPSPTSSTAHTEARLLDILCCEGCIMGAGFSSDEPVLQAPLGRQRATTRARQAGFDAGGLGGGGRRVRRRRPLAHLRAVRPALRRHADAGGAARRSSRAWASSRPEDELNCGACGYDTCRDHAVAI